MNDFEEFHSQVIRYRRIFWWLVTAWTCICLTMAVIEWKYVQPANAACHAVMPLLSSPAQVTLLALVIALAAYFRTIHSGALELRDKIRQGQVPNFPLHPKFEFTREKLLLLDGVAHQMGIASPFFIWLAIVVAMRITIETYMRAAWLDSQCNKHIFILDSIIALWLLVGFLALAIAHFIARTSDVKIRIEAREHEADALAYSKRLKKLEDESARGRL